jgi:hypothetical protein
LAALIGQSNKNIRLGKHRSRENAQRAQKNKKRRGHDFLIALTSILFVLL